MEDQPIQPQTWDKFRSSGLAWFINTTLHLFGWVLVFEVDDADGSVKSCYPARTKYRGFESEDNDEGYKKLTRFIRENAMRLDDEINS